MINHRHRGLIALNEHLQNGRAEAGGRGDHVSRRSIELLVPAVRCLTDPPLIAHS